MTLATIWTANVALFEWVLETTLQASLLIALILLTQSALRHHLSPAWRHGLWLLLLARLITPGLPESPTSIFNFTSRSAMMSESQPGPRTSSVADSDPIPDPAVADVQSNESRSNLDASQVSIDRSGSSVASGGDYNQPATTTVSKPSQQMIATSTPPWKSVGAAIWLLGAIAWATMSWITNRRFTARLRLDSVVDNHTVCDLFKRLLKEMNIRQRVELLSTEQISTPAVHGLFHKRLLLPKALIRDFDTQELRHVLKHELAHIKRHDLELHSVATILQCLHWFNPMIWFAFSRMRKDRELATDALAISESPHEEVQAYGATLIKLIEKSASPHRLAGHLGISQSPSEIAQRLRSIVSTKNRPRWRWIAIPPTIAIVGLTMTEAIDQPTASAQLESAQLGEDPFTLRIVDAEGGSPIEDANVRFEIEFDDQPTRTIETTTDGTGAARVLIDRSKPTAFRYSAQAENYLTYEGEWIKHQVWTLPDAIEIDAEQGALQGGIVVDEKNQPIPEARIYVNADYGLQFRGGPFGTEKVWRIDGGKLLATTDEDGRWTTRDLRAGSNYIIRIQHPMFADAIYSSNFTPAMEAENKGRSLDEYAFQDQTMRFVMGEGVSIAGRVVDESGAPLPNIPVSTGEIYPDGNPTLPMGRWEKSVTTDGNGRFLFDRLANMQRYFRIHAMDFAPFSKVLTPPFQEPWIEAKLTSGNALSVELLTPDGKPLNDAHVEFIEWSVWRGIDWRTTSDDSGEFNWAHAPETPFRLRITKPGFIERIATIQSRNLKNIVLTPTLTISGVVLDASNGLPIDNFQVAWSATARGWTSNPNPKIRFDDTDGSYELDLDRIYGRHWGSRYPSRFQFRIESEGYRPATSRSFSNMDGDIGEMTLDFELEPIEPLTGELVDGDGVPIDGAQVLLTEPLRNNIVLNDDGLFDGRHQKDLVTTNSQGEFEIYDYFTPDSQPKSGEGRSQNADSFTRELIATHPRGIAVVSLASFQENPTISLEKWARLEGVVRRYGAPRADVSVMLLDLPKDSSLKSRIARTASATTDSDGIFTFERLPPGPSNPRLQVSEPQGHESHFQLDPSEFNAGETTRVEIGGAGRPVVGKVELTNYHAPIDWQTDPYLATLRTATPPLPDGLHTDREIRAWIERIKSTGELKPMKRYPVIFESNGAFRVPEVPPGDYELSVSILHPTAPMATAYSHDLASINESITIPEVDHSASSIPYDIGRFEMVVELDEAPDFSAVSLEGNEFHLSDLRGKYVFLDIWGAWCPPCVEDVPYLKAAYERFGARENLVMLSLNCDSDIARARQFVETHELKGLQAYIGPYSDWSIPEFYRRGVPAMFVIDPEGNVVADRFEGEDISRTLDRILSTSTF